MPIAIIHAFDDNDEELANPDSMEEDNDYMDSYFDNGEDFID